MQKKESFKKITEYTIRGLPLAGIVYGSLQPARANLHPLLILAALVWFQVMMLFETFTLKK